MYITENDTTNIEISSIYHYKGVNNVISYDYKDFDKWDIKINTGLLLPDNTSRSYYLIIDTQFNTACGHWVYENAIYLPLFIELKKIYPSIKLHLQCHKDYKILYCKHFNIRIEDIVLDLSDNNTCFFPLPVSSQNKNTFSDELKLQIDAFSKYLRPITSKHINILLMPRQNKENYVNNDRKYIIDDISKNIQGDVNNIILNTDSIQTLQEQINIVGSCKNLILTGGAPYFINAIFCNNTNIIVLDDFSIGHIKQFIKVRYLDYLIQERNTVTFIPNKNNGIFTYDDIKNYLIV